MPAAALQAEVDAYIGQFTGERDEDGRRLVVRNGSAEPRTVLTSAGAVEVTAPRVNDKRADPVLLGDLAAVGAQDPAAGRGAAAAVPARPVLRRLRAARAASASPVRRIGVICSSTTPSWQTKAPTTLVPDARQCRRRSGRAGRDSQRVTRQNGWPAGSWYTRH